MIAPIRDTGVTTEDPSRTPRDVRQLVASLFLDEDRQGRRSPPPIARWKAWLLVSWAAIVTGIYLAAMLDLF